MLESTQIEIMKIAAGLETVRINKGTTVPAVSVAAAETVTIYNTMIALIVAE